METINELINEIYEDNYSHLEFMDNMNGGECDCTLYQAMWLIMLHWEGNND